MIHSGNSVGRGSHHHTSFTESSGGSGGDQLQSGVEDGGTPTEVVAEENKKS